MGNYPRQLLGMPGYITPRIRRTTYGNTKIFHSKMNDLDKFGFRFCHNPPTARRFTFILDLHYPQTQNDSFGTTTCSPDYIGSSLVAAFIPVAKSRTDLGYVIDQEGHRITQSIPTLPRLYSRKMFCKT